MCAICKNDKSNIQLKYRVIEHALWMRSKAWFLSSLQRLFQKKFWDLYQKIFIKNYKKRATY